MVYDMIWYDIWSVIWKDTVYISVCITIIQHQYHCHAISYHIMSSSIPYHILFYIISLIYHIHGMTYDRGYAFMWYDLISYHGWRYDRTRWTDMKWFAEIWFDEMMITMIWYITLYHPIISYHSTSKRSTAYHITSYHHHTIISYHIKSYQIIISSYHTIP